MARELTKPSGTTLHLCEQSSLAVVPRPARIYQLNPSATAIALALQGGQCKEAVVELVSEQSGASLGDTKRLVDDIEHALWPPVVQQAGSDAETQGILQWRRDNSRPAHGIAVRQYRLLDSCFLCHFGDHLLLQSAAEAFAHLEHSQAGPIAAEFEIGLACGQLQILCDRKRLGEMVTLDMLVNILRLVLAEASLAASDDEWAVHAAEVARGQQAVLLPGPAGRGKSTLALGLGAAGYKVLGDDTVVLASGTLEVRALPFPLSIKSGSWKLARTLLGASARFVRGRRMDGVSVRWLPRSAAVNLADPDFRATVNQIVFPVFAEDAPFQVRQLSYEETLRHLIPSLHALGTGLTASKVDRLIAWAKSRTSFELRYSRLEDAVTAVTELTS
jgi:hypothetical protein